MTNLEKARRILDKVSFKRFIDGKNVSFIDGNFHENMKNCNVTLLIEKIYYNDCGITIQIEYNGKRTRYMYGVNHVYTVNQYIEMFLLRLSNIEKVYN